MRHLKWSMTQLFSCAMMLMSGLLFCTPAWAEMGEPSINALFRADELEYGFNGTDNPLSWDLAAWVGGDWNRFWFKSDGGAATNSLEVASEAQLLYGRIVTPFWELQVGVRGDLFVEGSDAAGRGFLVVGLEGLAPFWFELEPTLFVSHRGDVSARFRATLDLFVTQRLIAQPSVETNVAAQEVAEFGVGAGLNDIELGLRLRYEFVREFAPYIGITWRQLFFKTADFAKAQGESAIDIQALAGLRFWF